MNRRMTALLAILAVLLVLTTVWAYGYMASQRDDAAGARANLAACLDLARQIEQFGRRSTIAVNQERVVSDVNAQIEKSARAAGISPESLDRIFPEPSRRIGDTTYKEKPTQVLLRRVTLKQLVTFAYAMASGDPPLHVKSIRVSAPRQEDSDDLWTGELALTYLIYEPLQLDR